MELLGSERSRRKYPSLVWSVAYNERGVKHDHGEWRVGTRVPPERAGHATSIKIAVCDESQAAIYGGGGNCTRGPVSATLCPICGYDLHPEGWPEHGREDEAVHELVAAWHGLAPEVREKIMEMVRG